MGCWNGTCGLTQMAILGNERAVWLPLISPRPPGGIATICYEVTDLFEPMGFALRGTYDDYGCLEKIDKTPGAKITLEYFQHLISTGQLVIKKESDTKKLKSLENLVNLIEREYLIVDKDLSPEDGMIATYVHSMKNRCLSHMMFHEEAFDSVVNSMKGRKPHARKKTYEECLIKSTEDWMGEDLPKSVGKWAIFSHKIAHMAVRAMTGAEYYFDRIWMEKRKDLIPAVVELHVLHDAMHLLRKMYQPQNGTGSQSSDFVLHEELAQFILRHSKKTRDAWRKDNPEETPKWDPFKETLIWDD